MTGACDSEVQQTVKIPQIQYPDRIVIQTVTEDVEVPQSQCLDRVVDVSVVMQGQSSAIQKVARTAEIL